MKVATLDCIGKKVYFNFKKEDFEVDLSEGDLDASWNSIKTKNGKFWNTEFTWEENDEDSEPSLSIYNTIKTANGLEMGEDEIYFDEVIIVNGDKENYFKIN